MWTNFGYLPPMFQVVLVSVAILLPLAIISEIMSYRRGR